MVYQELMVTLLPTIYTQITRERMDYDQFQVNVLKVNKDENEIKRSNFLTICIFFAAMSACQSTSSGICQRK